MGRTYYRSLTFSPYENLCKGNGCSRLNLLNLHCVSDKSTFYSPKHDCYEQDAPVNIQTCSSRKNETAIFLISRGSSTLLKESTVQFIR